MEWKKDKSIRRIVGLILCFISVVFGSLFLFQDKFCTITDYSDRVVSYASAVNISIGKLSFFYYYFLICAFLGLLCINMGISDSCIDTLRRKIGSIGCKTSRIGMIGKNSVFLSWIGMGIVIITFVLLMYIGKYSLTGAFTFTIVFAVGLLFKEVSLDDYLSRTAMVFVPVYSIDLLICSISVFVFRISIWNEVCFLMSFVLSALFYLKVENNKSFVIRAGLFCSSMLILVCFLIETCFTLKSRGLSEQSIVKFVIVGVIIYAVIASVLEWYFIKNNNIQTEAVRSHFMLIAVTAFAWINSIRDYKVVNFFESSNHGLSIFEYIRYGKIPVAETFDAHMLSNTFPGIVYYYINSDYRGALTSPYVYVYTIVLLISLYLIFSNLVGYEKAMVCTVFFPMSLIVADAVALPNPAAFIAGLFMIPVFLNWKKRMGVRSHVILWFFIVLSALIQLDTGVAFGIGALILALIELIKQRDRKQLLVFTSIGALFALIAVLIIAVIIYPSTDLIYWISRFINLSLSSQNWAIPILSFEEKVRFYLIYPLIMFIACIFGVRLLKGGETAKDILLFVMLSFLLNASRTIVRHTVSENPVYASCFVCLALLILLVLVINEFISRNKTVSFKKSGLLGIFVLLVMVSFVIVVEKEAFGKAPTNLDNIRIDLSAGRADYVNEYAVNKLNDLADICLKDDETLFDFSNFSNVYAYIDRPNPIYENQSPGLISGEFGQLDVIETLQTYRDSIPLVLMRSPSEDIGVRLDGILNTDRYYLITEYIYDNYVPFYSDEDYEIWCLQDRLSEMEGRLGYISSSDAYHFSSDTHYLGYIPYLWANKCEGWENYEKYSCSFLTLNIYSENTIYDCVVKVDYSNDTEEYYIINLLEGESSYLIRISTDYDYRISDIMNVQILDAPEETGMNYSVISITEGSISGEN